MRLVIAGGSGLTGSKLIEKLTADSRVTEITVLGRRPFVAASEKVKSAVVDFSHLDSFHCENQQDVFICCLGTTLKKAGSREAFRKIDYEAIVSCGQWAKQNNIKKFILISAAGAHINSLFYYSRIKGETENALKDLALQSLVILRPGLIVADRVEHRLGEKLAIQIAQRLRPVLPAQIFRHMATPLEDLVQSISDAMFRPTSNLQILEPSQI
jgi:uncharacterized protein YbjT (DUF2867 family)